MNKKSIALLLGVLMLLSLVGCLEKTEQPAAADKPAATAASAETAADGKTDDLPAFTLGDFTVTVGEVKSSYNTIVEYMGYYGMSAPSTGEEIKQYRDMIIEDLLSAKVLPWKAQQMGIELTDEKRAQVAQEVEELIAEYAGDYLDEAKTELGEDAGAAELAAKARALLKEDVESYFGYSFEQWLSEITASYEENALTEILQEDFNKGVTVTEEKAREWFDTELASQKESYDGAYSAYKEQLSAYEQGESDVPPLYVPEGFGRMQVITFDVDQDSSASYSANELEMTNLEAEYGKLVLRGLDEDRQAEIAARYQELQQLNANLMQNDQQKAEKARTDALNGMDFTQIFTTYSNEEGGMGYFGYAEGEERRNGIVTFYTKEQDTDWPEAVWKAACALKEGEIADLVQVENSFYLIKRLGDAAPGEAAFDDDPAAYTAAALSAKQAEEWEAVQQDWLREARNAAVFYEDNYAGVGL